MAGEALKDLIRSSSRPDVLAAGERAVYYSLNKHNVRFQAPNILTMPFDRKWVNFIVTTGKMVTLDTIIVEDRDFASRREFEVHVECRLKLANEEKAIARFLKAIGARGIPDAVFVEQLSEEVRECFERDRNLLDSFAAKRDQVEQDCAAWIDSKFGLTGRIRLELVDPTGDELALSGVRIEAMTLDSEKPIAPTFGITAQARHDEHGVVRIERPLTKDDLKDMVTRKIRDYLRQNVRLHEYYFSTDNTSWRTELRQLVAEPIAKLGREISDFIIESERPPYDVGIHEVRQSSEYLPTRYSSNTPVAISCTAQVSLTDAAKYEAGNRPQHSEWLRQQLDKAVATALFDQTYTDLLIGWPKTEDAIRGILEQEAKVIGLEAGTIITRPNIPAIKLREGVEITLPEKEYDTNVDGDRIKFSIVVNVCTPDLEKIKDVLDQHHQIIDYLELQIQKVADRFARGRSPENFYLQFYELAPGEEGDQSASSIDYFEPALSDQIQDLLKKNYHAESVDVEVRQHATDVVDRFNELKAHPKIVVPFTFRPLHQDDDVSDMEMGDVFCSVSVKVSAVDNQGWGRFRGYNWDIARRNLERRRQNARARCRVLEEQLEQLTSGSTDETDESARGVPSEIVAQKRLELEIARHEADKCGAFNQATGENSTIELAEMVAYSISDSLHKRLDTLPFSAVRYFTNEEQEGFDATVQSAANEAVKTEFGLSVETFELSRELTAYEGILNEILTKKRNLLALKASGELDQAYHKEQMANQRNVWALEAEAKKAQLLSRRRDAVLEKDNFDPEDLANVEDPLAEIFDKSKPGAEGSEREKRLMALLDKAETAFDEMPPPRADEDEATTKKREDLKAEVAYRRQQLMTEREHRKKMDSAALQEGVGLLTDRRREHGKNDGDGVN